MIDEETGMMPGFDALMSTFKRWVSSLKDMGIMKTVKTHC